MEDNYQIKTTVYASDQKEIFVVYNILPAWTLVNNFHYTNNNYLNILKNFR